MLTHTIRTAVLLCILGMLAVQANTVLDQIVAVVESDVITETELVERINVLRAQAGPDAQLPESNVLAAQVLERMILERLQIDWGQRRGIQVDDLSLDQAMRNLAARNNMDLNGFRNVLLKQGIDYVTFREQIRTEMTVSYTHLTLPTTMWV